MEYKLHTCKLYTYKFRFTYYIYKILVYFQSYHVHNWKNSHALLVTNFIVNHDVPIAPDFPESILHALARVCVSVVNM